MQADVQAARLEVETEALHDPHRERVLDVGGIGAGGPCGWRTTGLGLQDPCQQVRQGRFQGCEQGIDPGRAHVGFVLIHQRVVGRQAQTFALGRRRLAHQPEEESRG